jgi:putative protease
MTGKRKVELLAPAGSYEAFRAGLNAGADAFYLGAEHFGARAYARNFTSEELLNVLDEAHLYGRKVYLTINTLFKEKELNELRDVIIPLYEHGLDAVIVQDLGIFRLMRECFPDLALHASTQMTVTGYEGARFIEGCGASRVIPARELSLEEIKKIRSETSLEIECFVHGALCYCYSGACLMSSFIGGRSGNRGRCAQPCRMQYKVHMDGGLISDKNNGYALNTRDICLIDSIALLAQAGIDSFKIEGRMKRPEYVAGVVSVYRKYIDLYENGKDTRVSPDDKELLKALFNRGGFSSGYFFKGGRTEMMALKNERPSRDPSQNIEKAYKYVAENIIDVPAKKYLNAEFEVSLKKGAVLTVSDKETEASAVCADGQPAVSRPLTEETVCKQINKTGDTCFAFKALNIKISDAVFLTVKQLNDIRREALQKFRQKAASSYYRECPAAVCDRDENSSPERGTAEADPELTVSVLNKKQFELVKDMDELSGIYVPWSVFLNELTDGEREAYRSKIIAALPYISRYGKSEGQSARIEKQARKGTKFLVRNLEDAAFLIEKGYAGSIRLDYTLYTMNGSSRGFWRDMSVEADTAPVELNRSELADRDNSGSELIIYGRIPLMVSAQCVVKNYSGCDRLGRTVYLTDRTGASFPAVSDCENCYGLIYNSVPISLLSEAGNLGTLGFKRCRVILTFENEDAALDIIHKAAAAVKDKKGYAEAFAFTKGHFRRGVI